jgi:DNA-binding FadR family transcriptional regulator
MNVLSRDTLADQLTQELFLSLTNGSLLPGRNLPSEAELASRFGVSRAVVRESLGHLKAMGVVEVTNGKKAVVKAPDYVPLTRIFSLAAAQRPDALTQLLEARCGIESECAYLAAERRNVASLEAIGRLLEAMDSLVQDPEAFDATRYAELDRDFHLEVARASQNLLLEQLAQSIREPMKQSILLGLSHQDSHAQRRRIQATHREIAEAIEQCHSERARAAMRSHLMGATRRILAASHDLLPQTGQLSGPVPQAGSMGETRRRPSHSSSVRPRLKKNRET